jgi:uncharacterized membrane protein HdeD (DUF308 family)
MARPEPGTPLEVAVIDRETVADSWGWFIALGVLSLVAGVLAIILPAAAALAVEIVVGVLLVFEGIFLVVRAVQLRSWPGTATRAVLAVLALLAGILLLVFPPTGVLTLALIVGVYFIVAGILTIIQAFQVRRAWGWAGLLISGILSVILGALVLFIWPEMAAPVLGILVGVHLVFSGAWLIALGVSARGWRPAEEGRPLEA